MATIDISPHELMVGKRYYVKTTGTAQLPYNASFNGTFLGYSNGTEIVGFDNLSDMVGLFLPPGLQHIRIPTSFISHVYVPALKNIPGVINKNIYSFIAGKSRRKRKRKGTMKRKFTN